MRNSISVSESSDGVALIMSTQSSGEQEALGLFFELANGRPCSIRRVLGVDGAPATFVLLAGDQPCPPEKIDDMVATIGARLAAKDRSTSV